MKRYLHFSDDAGNNQGDKLHKIRFILDHCRDNASTYHTEKLALLRQYMKDQPVKFRIKMWVAADSAHCVIDVYVGKYNTASTEHLDYHRGLLLNSQKSSQTISILVRNWPTISSLATLTSVVLSEPTEKDFQSHLLNLKLNKGEFKEVIFIGLCVGLCLHLFWKDNRIVYYLSTFHAPEDGQLRTNQNRWDTKRFNRLTDSKAYPQYMGGVDRLDQMTRVDKEKKAWGGT